MHLTSDRRAACAQGVLAEEDVHTHLAHLRDAVEPIDGLLVHGRVPPAEQHKQHSRRHRGERKRGVTHVRTAERRTAQVPDELCTRGRA